LYESPGKNEGARWVGRVRSQARGRIMVEKQGANCSLLNAHGKVTATGRPELKCSKIAPVGKVVLGEKRWFEKPKNKNGDRGKRGNHLDSYPR